MDKFNMGELSRIWVCGPPKMNETFDRAFTELKQEGLRIEPHQIEILWNKFSQLILYHLYFLFKHYSLNFNS